MTCWVPIDLLSPFSTDTISCIGGHDGLYIYPLAVGKRRNRDSRLGTKKVMFAIDLDIIGIDGRDARFVVDRIANTQRTLRSRLEARPGGGGAGRRTRSRIESRAFHGV